MTSYCTLQGARRQLEVGDETTDSGEDAKLFYYAVVAAASIDDWTGNWFDDRVLQLGFNGNVGQGNPALYLKELPLAALDTLTNGNGDVIASANYTLLPTGTYPKQKVRLAQGYYWRGPNDPSGSSSGGQCAPFGPLANDAYAEDAIQLAGHWVWHRNYARAWRRIGLTLESGMNDGTATLILTAPAGTALDVGNIIRVTTGAATEQMLITGPIEDSTSEGFDTAEITVERGVNGTNPIDHDPDDVIDVWIPEPIITNAAEMCAAAFYKGRANATGDAQIVEGFTRMVIPVDMPAKIKGMLVSPYRSWRRGRP